MADPFSIDPYILQCHHCGGRLRVVFLKADDEGDNLPGTVQAWPDGSWYQDCLGCGLTHGSNDGVPHGCG